MRTKAWWGLLLAATACGSGGLGGAAAGPSSGPEAFLGLWDSGGVIDLRVTTPLGEVARQAPAGGLVLVERGAAPDDIVFTDEQGCALPATVSGTTATVPAGAACAVAQGSASTVLTFQSGTLALEPGGASLSFEASGTLATTNAANPDAGGTGTFDWTATLVRAP